MSKIDYTSITDASRFLEIPKERLLGLIRTGQLNGVTIPGTEEGYVQVDDILDLAET